MPSSMWVTIVRYVWTEPPSVWEILSSPRDRLRPRAFPRASAARCSGPTGGRALAAFLPADEVHRAIGDEVGEIAGLVNLRLALAQVVDAGRIAVREIVDAAAHHAEEFLVAALQRAEVRREAQVPLAREGGRVARGGQQRRQGRMSGRQTKLRIAARARSHRLVRAAAQPVLPPPGHQREARGRADRRVRVPVGEAQAFGGHAVELRGALRPPAIAAEVGVPEVIGEDENEIGFHAAIV